MTHQLKCTYDEYVKKIAKRKQVPQRRVSNRSKFKSHHLIGIVGLVIGLGIMLYVLQQMLPSGSLIGYVASKTNDRSVTPSSTNSRITDVTVVASPESQTAYCPATVTFTATITADGPGTFTYTWL